MIKTVPGLRFTKQKNTQKKEEGTKSSSEVSPCEGRQWPMTNARVRGMLKADDFEWKREWLRGGEAELGRSL